MSLLNKANFKCPAPIINNKNKTITDFEGKKLMIVSFLEGKAKKNFISRIIVNQVGIEIAKMHQLTKNFKIKRKMIYLLNHGEIYLIQLKINVQKFIKIYLN